MSAYRHVSRAIIRTEKRPVSHNAMVVLAVMATWADPRDAEPVCFKEQESIAQRAKLSPRAVRTCLTELERAGLIKRLGVVGGHATKRGTVRWGLILLWGDDPLSAPRADKGGAFAAPRADKGSSAFAAPRADKEGTPAPRADKGAAPRADKEAAPRADNSNQSQSDQQSDDDDDSGAPAPGDPADAPRAPAPLRTATAVSGKPIDPATATGEASTLARTVMAETGWSSAVAERWVTTTLAGRNVKQPAAYIRASLDRLAAEPPAKAAKKAAAKTPPAKKAAPARRASKTPPAKKAAPTGEPGKCRQCGAGHRRNTTWGRQGPCPRCADPDPPKCCRRCSGGPVGVAGFCARCGEQQIQADRAKAAKAAALPPLPRESMDDVAASVARAKCTVAQCGRPATHRSRSSVSGEVYPMCEEHR